MAMTNYESVIDGLRTVMQPALNYVSVVDFIISIENIPPFKDYAIFLLQPDEYYTVEYRLNNYVKHNYYVNIISAVKTSQKLYSSYKQGKVSGNGVWEMDMELRSAILHTTLSGVIDTSILLGSFPLMLGSDIQAVQFPFHGVKNEQKS